MSPVEPPDEVTIVFWRNRVVTALGSASFALIGLSTAVEAPDSGSRIFGLALAAMCVALGIRGALAYSVRFQGATLSVRTFLRTKRYQLEEVDAIRGVGRVVLLRSRLALAIVSGPRTDVFPDISQPVRRASGVVTDATDEFDRRRQHRAEGETQPVQ